MPEEDLSDVPVIRTSERGTFKKCVQKWEWSWRWGLESKGLTAAPLWFGTGIHLAFSEWYCGPGSKRGPHPAETWEKYAADAIVFAKTQRYASEDNESRMVDLKALGIVLMDEYVKKYGRDEHMLIISPEQTFELMIPWPEAELLHPLLAAHRETLSPARRKWLARYVGTFDLVWRHAGTGQLWLEEHKSAGNVYTGHLALDDQGGTYWTMAYRTLLSQGLIKKTDTFKGIEYNFVRKAMPDDRPRDEEGYATNKPTKDHYIRALAAPGIGFNAVELKKLKLDELAAEADRQGLIVLGERSKVQQPPLFERHEIHRTSSERATQLRRVQNEALHMETVREGILPVTKTPARDCRRFCQFYEMCELQEQNGNWRDMRDLAFRSRDPYIDHRKSTDVSD